MRRKILLVWPPDQDREIHYVPLALAYLKSNLDPERYDVEILDTVLEDLTATSPEFRRAVVDARPDLVGFSITSVRFAQAVELAQVVKEVLPATPVVAGGIHVTSYTKETMASACFDFGFTGEAEHAFPRFLDRFFAGDPIEDCPGLAFRDEDGELHINPMDARPELDTIRMPDYDAINLGRYHEKGYAYASGTHDHAPVWLSRGCPYKCQFCASPILNGRTMRYHGVQYVRDLIEGLHVNHGITFFNIIDDNFTFDMDASKEILKTLIDIRNRYDRRIDYQFPNGIRMQRVDREILELMKAAGLEFIVYAPESGSPDVLKAMRKGLKTDVIFNSIRLAKEVGIRVWTFWIVGYPGETSRTLEETREVMLDSGADFITLNIFHALPGTPIFDRLVGEGRLEKTYLPQSYTRLLPATYVTETLSHRDIEKFMASTYVRFYLMRPKYLWGLLRFQRPDILVRNAIRVFGKALRLPVPA